MLNTLKTMLGLREGLAFQLGAWALAVAMCLALAANLREHVRAQALKSELQVPGIEVRSAALQKDDYLAVRERVGRAYSDTGVTFSASESGLVIKTARLEDYLQWRLAVADVMLSMPGAVWSVKSLCAGEKCTEGAFSATVTGMVRSFGVQEGSASRNLTASAQESTVARR